jgi:hypothetical protein
MPHPIYSGPEWQAVRRLVLERDGHRCQLMCSTKCQGVATHCDHIVDVLDGGARLDPANLRAACRSCNIAQRNRRVAARARAARGEPPAIPTPSAPVLPTYYDEDGNVVVTEQGPNCDEPWYRDKHGRYRLAYTEPRTPW